MKVSLILHRSIQLEIIQFVSRVILLSTGFPLNLKQILQLFIFQFIHKFHSIILIFLSISLCGLLWVQKSERLNMI